MKSFSGKFTSVRGWALLLALVLGAGIFISACGDEEVPAPTAPAPPPAPPPAPAPEPEPEPEPTGPATPENLRVTGTTSSSITWSWNAVEGALGYQGQFSTDATFTETDPTFIVVAPATSHTVSNLSGNMTGHFRVRSGTGTSLTDLTYSDWTDGVSGTTAPPPAAQALAAPDDVRSTDRTEDSITLEWDSVDNAETYEVEQREPGDSWSDASCGGEDNEVEDTECVASDLDEGTDYDFRVRGVPADDDEAYTVGTWSEVAESRTDGTAPVEPTAPVGGGMGNLNVRWTSSSAGIEWTWDRLADKTYDYEIFNANELPRMDAANPCEDAVYETANSGVAATDASVDQVTALLCVRTTNEDDRMENLSFAWAVKPPATAPTVGTASPGTDSGKATRSLTWGGIGVTRGFSYEIKTVADPMRDNRITATDPAPGSDELQRTCDGGNLLESDETDVDLTGLETTLTNVKPHTGYLLCYRMLNSSGATDWVAPASNAEHETAPATAPRPAKDGSRSEDDRTAASETIVWEVRTRGTETVPRLQAGYNIFTIRHPSRNDGADDDNLHDDNVARPRAVDCGDTDFTTDPYTRVDVSGSAAPTSQGFAVTITPQRPTTAVTVRTTGTTDEILPDVISLCVQAKGTGTIVGPWSISSAETLEKVTPSN